jgi:hypothetical protein
MGGSSNVQVMYCYRCVFLKRGTVAAMGWGHMGANIGSDSRKRNSHRLWAGSLAVILGVLTAALGVAHADELYWRQYRSIDDGFLIDAPAPPKIQSSTAQTPFGPVNDHSYAVFPGPDGVIFMVSAAQKSTGDKRSDADILAASVKNVPNDVRTELTVSGVKGIDFGFDNAAGDKTRMRIFVDKGRTFIVQASGPKAVFPQEMATRWLQSWRPVPTEIPADWHEYKYPEDGFAIRAPSRPAVMKETGDTAFGPVPARKYMFVPDAGADNGVEFDVAAVEKHAKDTRSEGERLEAAAHAGNLPEDAFVVIRQSGLTGYYYEFIEKNVRFANATFVHGDRRYTIFTRVPDGGVSPEAKAWMMSWRLLEPGEK